MINGDTVKLLRECDAGIKMGISSIEDVYPYAKSEPLKNSLRSCKNEHQKLENEIEKMLWEYHDEGKDPNPLAKSMSWLKTGVKLGIDESDSTIADLITDGCNMGVKTLNRYLNEYGAADEQSKDIAKKLINLEEQLAMEIRGFL